MSLNIETKYPGKSSAADADYPFGSARNITTPGDGTGTPLEQSWLNDWFGAQQAILQDAGFTPNGNPDTVQVAQFVSGLGSRFNRFFPTVAEAKADKRVVEDQYIFIQERNEKFKVVDVGAVTPNGADIIENDASTLAFKIDSDRFSMKGYGVVADGSDQSVAIASISANAAGSTILVDVEGVDHSNIFQRAMVEGGSYTHTVNLNILTWTATVTAAKPFSITSNKERKIEFDASIVYADGFIDFDTDDFEIIKTELIANSAINFIDTSNMTADRSRLRVFANKITGFNRFAYCSNTSTNPFFLRDSYFNENDGHDFRESFIRITQQKMEGVRANYNTINGSARNGIYLGFVEDDGTGVLQKDIVGTQVIGNRIYNVRTPVDPLSVGSYSIHVEGTDCEIQRNLVRGHRPVTTDDWSNNEPIYTKVVHSNVCFNHVIESTGNQGMITVKGTTDDVLHTAVDGRHTVVSDNIMRIESDAAPFNNTTGLFVQSDLVDIYRNTFDGMTNRCITVLGSPTLATTGAKIRIGEGNTFINFKGFWSIVVGRKIDHLDIDGTNWKTPDSGNQFLIRLLGELNTVNITNNDFDMSEQVSVNKTIVDIDSGVTALNTLTIEGNKFNSPQTMLRHNSTIDVPTLNWNNNEIVGNVTNYFIINLASTGEVTKMYARGNQGHFERVGPLDLGVSFGAGVTQESNGLFTKGMDPGDTLDYALNLPDGVYVFSTFNKSAELDLPRFLVNNSTGGAVDLTGTVGNIQIVKAGAALSRGLFVS